MSSDNQYGTTTTPDSGPYGTGGYMLSVKISTHPALVHDAPMSTTAYNCTVNTTPNAADGTVITLTYYHGTTDITSTVDTYFSIVASGGGCTTATPSDIPTTMPTANGTFCFTFEKNSGYTTDHTFTVNVSGTDATNSPTTPAF